MAAQVDHDPGDVPEEGDGDGGADEGQQRLHHPQADHIISTLGSITWGQQKTSHIVEILTENISSSPDFNRAQPIVYRFYQKTSHHLQILTEHIPSFRFSQKISHHLEIFPENSPLFPDFTRKHPTIVRFYQSTSHAFQILTENTPLFIDFTKNPHHSQIFPENSPPFRDFTRKHPTISRFYQKRVCHSNF